MVISVLKDIDSLADVVTWTDAFGSTYPVLGDLDEEVWDQYKNGIASPQYLVIDRDGTIMYKSFGSPAAAEAEVEVTSLL